MDILQIKNLIFKYNQADKNALENISFSIKQGEFVVICGESGCGKTTLLKMLKPELTPFGDLSGETVFNDKKLSGIDAKNSAADIGFVGQNPENQIVTDKVWHELAFGLENLGVESKTIRRRVAEMASYFGIEEWFHKNTNELSGGQKQLLNLASVMVMQPKVLLLDEPTAQLDPIAAANFISTLQKLNQELGLTILLVEHRLEEVLTIADKILLLENGKLVYADTPRNIGKFFKENPDNSMINSLPAAMRIFNGLDVKSDCPLTVKEGREFITKHFKNEIDTIKTEPYFHSKNIAIELKNVRFRYEKDLPDVLKDVSLCVYQGENYCILGGNGTGKTTTLNVISGLLKVYKGKVLINGKKIEKYNEKALYRNNIALLAQNPQTVFLEKTVKEDFFEVCKAMEFKNEEAENEINKISEKLGISHLLEKHPYDLSGGEQQKSALAKILLLQPKILLLDEPTKGIDASAKLTLSHILKELQNEGITIITVTHDVEFVAANANRCALFFNGEIVSVDTPNSFFTDNNFYTTASHRISRGYYKNAVLCEDVVSLCKQNSRKETTCNE